LVVIVKSDAPPLTVKLGAFETVPPVVPNVTVAVAAIFLVNPPVPVQVKFVAVGIANIVDAGTVIVSAMLPEPNEIARVFVLLEEKIPVLNVLLFKLSVPWVSVNVLFTVNASPRVTVIPEPLTPQLLKAFPKLVKVVEATNVGPKLVYVPVVERVKSPAIFAVGLPPETEQELPVKFKFLNQLVAVIVNKDDPPFTVRLGAFDEVPPVVPNTIVAVAAMLRVNPPVPVQEKLVTVAIDNTVVAAVVLVSAMLPEPKVMARVDDPEELKIPVLKVKLASARVPAVRVVVHMDDTVSASASVTVIPAPLTVMPHSVFPALVSVAVAINIMAGLIPVVVNVIPEEKVALPERVRLAELLMSRVPMYPVQSIDFATRDALTVTVPPPELKLKNTSSAAVGTEAPPTPPEVADQLAVFAPDQLPEPPIQYLLAMLYSCGASMTGLTTASQLVKRSCFMTSSCSSVRPWSSGRFSASQNEPNGVSNLKMICMMRPYACVVTAMTSQRVFAAL